jgi:hypothetical protein
MVLSYIQKGSLSGTRTFQKQRDYHFDTIFPLAYTRYNSQRNQNATKNYKMFFLPTHQNLVFSDASSHLSSLVLDSPYSSFLYPESSTSQPKPRLQQTASKFTCCQFKHKELRRKLYSISLKSYRFNVKRTRTAKNPHLNRSKSDLDYGHLAPATSN